MLKVDKTGVEDARFRAETVWVIWDIYDKEMGVFFAKRKKEETRNISDEERNINQQIQSL